MKSVICLGLLFVGCAPAGNQTPYVGLVRSFPLGVRSTGGQTDPTDVYYPLADGPFPVVVLLQGANVGRQSYSGFSQTIAESGFIVVVPDHFRTLAGPTGPLSGLLSEEQVLLDAQSQVLAESARASSPIYRRVDATRLGVLGHSWGGATALYATEGVCQPLLCSGSFARPKELRASLVYGTFLRDSVTMAYSAIHNDGVAVSILQGDKDGNAPAAAGAATYEQLQPPRAYMVLNGANHFGICDENPAPGAKPDASAPTLAQPTGVERAGRWAALFLRAHVIDDPVARQQIYESPGDPDGVVTIPKSQLAQ